METKEELKQHINDLNEALRDADTQVGSLENDVDYHREENSKLENRVDELEGGKDELEEKIEAFEGTPTIKQLHITLCDRYALNHFTEWTTLLFKLMGEASR